MFLVQLRLDRIRMQEAELLALASPPQRAEAVKKALKGLNESIFPGHQDHDDLAEARKMLEKEVQNALVMRPKAKSMETIKQMLQSPHQGLRDQAAKDLERLEASKQRLQSRMNRPNRLKNIQTEDL